jgi:hypothetical protein
VIRVRPLLEIKNHLDTSLVPIEKQFEVPTLTFYTLVNGNLQNEEDWDLYYLEEALRDSDVTGRRPTYSTPVEDWFAVMKIQERIIQRVELVKRADAKLSGKAISSDKIKDSPLKALKHFYAFKGKPNFHYLKPILWA